MKHLITTVSLIAASPALAQHQGHSAPAQPAPEQPAAEAGSADPHAGHQMESRDAARPTDHGMDHAMPSDGSARSDPHAGHDMPSPGSAAAMPEMGGMDPHAGHAMPQGESAPPPSAPPPSEAFSGPPHAADTLFDPIAMEESREALRVEQGGFTTHGFFVDRLETQIREGEDAYVWDINAWYGGDLDKFWVKSEGEGLFGGELEEAEIQALWSRAIGPYFDFQAGFRYDIRPEPDRTHIVAGVMGLAPYFFEIDAAAFLSDEGDLTARVEAEYDQRITQRLILQPRIEASFAAQDIPEIDIGAGLSSIEAGLRLRYEFVPEFAPYIGVEWQQLVGQTADYARAAGEDPGKAVFLAGVRVWF